MRVSPPSQEDHQRGPSKGNTFHTPYEDISTVSADRVQGPRPLRGFPDTPIYYYLWWLLCNNPEQENVPTPGNGYSSTSV